jgi:uroporphyrin-III C-methyltransferase/precorrin-2 dehydrogenase/sirohydrochlorin ferrochelatase
VTAEGFYVLELDLTGRTVLVVGGGPVAARHARHLAAAAADVLAVAPEICEDLSDLVDSAKARWLRRELSVDDLTGVWLVHAATGSSESDARVVALCEFARVWCIAESTPTASARPPVPPGGLPATGWAGWPWSVEVRGTAG